MFRWVIKEQLAAGPRPRRKNKPTSQVPKSVVDAWIRMAKDQYGIRSIICLLDQKQLRLYAELRMDLISYYRASGFEAAHIAVRNYKHPALNGHELKKVLKAYKSLEQTVLIHCSAGIGRTGKAASYLKGQLSTRHGSVRTPK